MIILLKNSMNVAYEFSKVKDSFSKVKADMEFLGKKITDNYENFMREHYKLSSEVHKLSSEMKSHIEHVKNHHLNPEKDVSHKEFLDLKYVVKELKDEVEKTQKEHNKVTDVITELQKDTKDIKVLKEKLESSELEIFLLKEKLNKKDQEIKQVKEISSHLFDLITELSTLEKEMTKVKR